MIKKSALLFSCNNILSSALASKTSPQSRQYAMTSNGHSKHDHGSIRWPEKISANAIPTPYQIFNQKKGSEYSKLRFYELVKIYHPDRHDCNVDDGLSYTTKLERYRLVVAANDILSNPVKRVAYDRYGAGWNGTPDVILPREASEAPHSWGGYEGWDGSNGPSRNATWEDWEKWYQRDAQGPQSPCFVSNTAFVFLILVFAVLGGLGQASRAEKSSMSFFEQTDALHNDMSKELMRRRRETSGGFGGQDERIRSFLKQREPFDYKGPDDSHKKLLPAPAAQGETKGKDVISLPPPKN